MLKIPPAFQQKIDQVTQDPNLQKDMKNLYDKLKEKESFPNIITLEVFRKFEPLFQVNNTLSKEDVDSLTQDFVSLIDFYKETQIIMSSTNSTVVLTLPSIFTPVRSLEQTEKNASLVATNAAMANSNVPKYSGDAFANMFRALTVDQKKNADVIKTYKENYISCVTNFFNRYNKPKTVAQESSDNTSDYNSSHTEWDME